MAANPTPTGVAMATIVRSRTALYPAVNPVGTNGIYVFDQMMPVWAREIGVPVRFSAPVRISVEDNQMTKIEGGAEATAVRGFREALARRVGEKNAFEIRGPHGGVHPHAIVSPSQCPDEEYREFVASFHTGAVHMHLGQASESASFPFNLHTAAEARGATFKVGSNVLHDHGRLAVADDPRVSTI